MWNSVFWNHQPSQPCPLRHRGKNAFCRADVQHICGVLRLFERSESSSQHFEGHWKSVVWVFWSSDTFLWAAKPTLFWPPPPPPPPPLPLFPKTEAHLTHLTWWFFRFHYIFVSTLVHRKSCRRSRQIKLCGWNKLRRPSDELRQEKEFIWLNY